MGECRIVGWQPKSGSQSFHVDHPWKLRRMGDPRLDPERDELLVILALRTYKWSNKTSPLAMNPGHKRGQAYKGEVDSSANPAA